MLQMTTWLDKNFSSLQPTRAIIMRALRHLRPRGSKKALLRRHPRDANRRRAVVRGDRLRDDPRPLAADRPYPLRRGPGGPTGPRRYGVRSSVRTGSSTRTSGISRSGGETARISPKSISCSSTIPER
ncbi:hypothetical protein [Methanoculleus chikugoensis]|uniref:hypothetical protein n=1 Tax=Methanoculleus chikugoensis TaxID=118126 RepID=UPI000B097B70|nr:hypothetical protein [Methanoculleus chikugoensis]